MAISVRILCKFGYFQILLHTSRNSKLTATTLYACQNGLSEAETRYVGVKFFHSINMQEVVTRTVNVSSKVAACGEKNPYKLYILNWCWQKVKIFRFSTSSNKKVEAIRTINCCIQNAWPQTPPEQLLLAVLSSV